MSWETHFYWTTSAPLATQAPIWKCCSDLEYFIYNNFPVLAVKYAEISSNIHPSMIDSAAVTWLMTECRPLPLNKYFALSFDGNFNGAQHSLCNKNAWYQHLGNGYVTEIVQAQSFDDLRTSENPLLSLRTGERTYRQENPPGKLILLFMHTDMPKNV